MPLRFLAMTLLNAIVFSLLKLDAFGNESSLILPTHIDESVIVELPEENINWETTNPSSLLQVFVGQLEECCENSTPMAGQYKRDRNKLIFTPAFGFVAGQDYIVLLQKSQDKKGGVQERTEFSIDLDTPPEEAKVVGIYPSGDVLPENVLRFYIHFAKPMKPHVAFDYIKLLDASGNPDDAAFMKFKQELWNEDRTRLTLLIDPGRIKRKVTTNIRLGSVLFAGKRYKLMVEGGWPTADGTSVLTTFSKSFVVSEALRDLPNTDRWNIIAPDFGTQGAIEIRFDRPFDHQLLHKDIRVFSEDGQKISGEIQIGNNENQWRFLPDRPWRTRKVFLIVNSVLEDVAGNNFKDLLDHTVDTETVNISQITIPIALNQ